MFFNPDIETLPLGNLRKLQSERLRNLVNYVYERVPFYRDQFDLAAIRPSDIKSIDDLTKIPFTKKDDLRDHYPFGFFAVPSNEIIRIHCSSGTTGKPTVVGYTQRDIEIFSEVCARSLVAGGARPGMKLQNAYGYGLFTGGLGLHYGGEKLNMSVIPVSGGMTDRQILLLKDFKPEVMSCTPSYALALAEEITRHGIDIKREMNLQYMILGAEPWTETIRQNVEQMLQVKATNIYGLSEIIGPGVSQEDVDERDSGSYVWEDHFFPEIVHPESGEPVPYGEYGVLVFTTLTKEAMPLLRYRTNDICSLNYDPQGKRTHIKMSPIRGRSDDMVIIRGVNLFPSQVESLLNGLPGFSSNYQLMISREGALDVAELLIELEEMEYKRSGIDDVASSMETVLAFRRRLEAKIKDNLGITMKVSIQNYQTLPRSEGGN